MLLSKRKSKIFNSLQFMGDLMLRTLSIFILAFFLLLMNHQAFIAQPSNKPNIKFIKAGKLFDSEKGTFLEIR